MLLSHSLLPILATACKLFPQKHPRRMENTSSLFSCVYNEENGRGYNNVGMAIIICLNPHSFLKSWAPLLLYSQCLWPLIGGLLANFYPLPLNAVLASEILLAEVW